MRSILVKHIFSVSEDGSISEAHVQYELGYAVLAKDVKNNDTVPR